MAPFDPDPQQRRVLEHDRGRLLVTGGFGTGKTAVLREAFARLIEGGADPERVALVVGSRRARDEAREALRTRLPIPLPSLRVTTVHGLAYQIVSRRFRELGYREPPALLTAPDQFAKVQELLHGEDPSQWRAYGGLLRLRGFADQVRQFVLRAQETLLTPDEIERRAARGGLTGWLELAAFHRRYLEVLDAEERVDFAGLVEQAAAAAGHGDPLVDHVLLDDYQDATFGAERLLAELGAESLVVAGNADAHVFSFQGTTDEPLRRFAERFPGSERVRLSTDHRCASLVAEAWCARHTSEEHAAVARELRWIHLDEGVPWRELAVVVRRQGAHVGGLIRALDDAGVPRVVPESGLSLSGDPATLPFTLALRWVARPSERDGLVEPVLTSELCGLSPATARGLLRVARAGGLPPSDTLGILEGLTPEEGERLAAVRSALRDAEEVSASVIDAFDLLWKRLPVSADLVAAADTSPQARRGLDAVLALARAVERAGGSRDSSVAAFVDLLEAGSGGPGANGHGDDARDAVRVLTAHGTAGMEFDTVIVPGAVEGDFPSLARPEPMFDLTALEGGLSRSEQVRRKLEDERRLFRLVLGRARRRVVLTASDPQAREQGLRSRFVDELGLGWGPPPEASSDPVSVAEAAAAWRRTLADATAPAPERLASIDGLLALGVEPGRWWFQRDWTDTGRPLHEQLRLSYSRLESLENCELQFVLGEELGLSRRGGHQAWVGKLVHQLIEECEAGRIERSLEALLAELDARWEEARFPSRAVSDGFKQLAAQRMLPTWWTYFGQLSATASEVGFTFEFDGATIAGVIDRIGPHPTGSRITDFKTGKPDRAPKAADSLQLGIYYLAVNEAPELAPYRPVRAVDLAYLRGDWKGEYAELAWPVSPSGEEEYQTRVRERLSDLIARIRSLAEAETWRPDPGAECFFCDFKPLCPLYPEGQPLFPVQEGPS
ncbi:MAG TPA: ATP-dependent DNA helicase [Actinomycetota bacterium]